MSLVRVSSGRGTRAIAVLAGVALLSSGCSRTTPADQLYTAARAMPTRVSTARLSTLPYAPRPRVVRGENGNALTLTAAAHRILGETDDRHLRGLAHLLLGNVGVAAETLRAAAAAEPRDAAIWNDLAVATFEHAKRLDDPQELVTALAATDEALRIAPRDAAALFTRAEILDALALSDAATAAYAHYLAVDGSSVWAHEARSRKPPAPESWDRVQEQWRRSALAGDTAAVEDVVRRFPQHARAYAETEYLARWGGAELRGDATAAAQEVAIARIAGRALASRSQEHLLRDAVAAIDNADARSRRELALGHVAYRDARMAYDTRRLADAEPLFDAAIARFEAARSPMLLYARHYRANLAFDLHDAMRCLRVQDDLRNSAPRNYRALHAHVLQQRATALGHAGRYFESLADATESLRIFEQLGERANAARMRSNRAALQTHMGDTSAAWQERRRAFSDIAAAGNPKLLEALLNAAARAEMGEARWTCARALYEVQLNVAHPTPRYRFDALLGAAYAAARAGSRPQHSFADLLAAAAKIPDPALRDDAMQDAKLVRAILVRDTGAREALALLNELLDAPSTAVNAARLPQIHVERARTYARLGETEASLSDYRRALQLIETQGVSIPGDELRDGFLGSAQNTYNELAATLVRHERVEEAFAVLERSRHRGLFADAAPIPLSELQRRLPADVAVVEHGSYADRLFTIVVTSRSVAASSFAITDAQFRRLADGFQRAVASDATAEYRAAGQRLFAMLLAPAFQHAPATRRLVIVTGAASAGIPFNALVADDGRFAVERADLRVAPSASAWVMARPPVQITPNALIVADPAFDARTFPRLSRLPGAEREARRVARAYSQPTILTGAEATLPRVMRAIRDASVIHIAAHALTNERDARFSAIPLAGASRAALYLRQIRELQLRASPVVVLAGCRTASPGGGRPRADSLATAFLAAGSRAVIATTWDLDDQFGAIAAPAFHERLSAGTTAATALRETQLGLLADPETRAPRVWGAWQAYEIGVAPLR